MVASGAYQPATTTWDRTTIAMSLVGIGEPLSARILRLPLDQSSKWSIA